MSLVGRKSVSVCIRHQLESLPQVGVRRKISTDRGLRRQEQYYATYDKISNCSKIKAWVKRIIPSHIQ